MFHVFLGYKSRIKKKNDKYPTTQTEQKNTVFDEYEPHSVQHHPRWKKKMAS